jgi:AcrR family transcriptional regulator
MVTRLEERVVRKTGDKKTVTRPAGAPVVRRTSREERERAIVTGAINYFAEVGFSGQLRALAERIGVSQALLFKHFATKDRLIERVFQDVYLKRWNPAWESILEDRRFNLKDRLIKFYDSYVETCADRQWIRIFMFASLARNDINTRYLSLIGDRIIPKICAGMRLHANVASEAPFSDEELQMAWALHGSIIYYLIQRNIYEDGHPDSKLVVRSRVSVFVDGVHLGTSATQKPAPADHEFGLTVT